MSDTDTPSLRLLPEPIEGDSTRMSVAAFWGDTRLHAAELDPSNVSATAQFDRELRRQWPAVESDPSLAEMLADEWHRVLAEADRSRHTAKAKTHTPEADQEYVTELANAQELVQRHGADMRYNVDTGAWMVYAGNAWKDDHSRVPQWTKEIARETWTRLQHLDSKLVARHASRMETAAGIAGVLKLASTEPGIPIRQSDLDADPFLFNCRNTAIDLRTCQPKDHERGDLCARVAPVTYDPRAVADLWLSVMNRIMGSNERLIAYVQRVAGLCLTGDPTVHELLILHGAGANGKSVFVDTLLGLLGPYAGMAPESLLMQRTHQEHPTELADLCGKRLVVASETEEAGRLRVQLVKRLTGDTTIKGRFMRQDFFEFPRTHKLLMVTNNRPRINEDTEAVWRRIKLIPFAVTIPLEERDTHLLEKLHAERSGILNWCLAGCLAWQRQGMDPPAEVLAATADYRAEADPLADFVQQRVIVAAGCRVTRNDLFSVYQSFAVQAGDKHPLDRTAFFERMRRIDGVADGSWRSGGVAVRGFTGIGLLQAQTENDSETCSNGGVL